jgi:hypothetical protein
MGDKDILDLLANRPKLRVLKIIWTLNAPGWVHKSDLDDLLTDRARWDEAARHIERVFKENAVLARVIPWLESADRRLWEQPVVAEGG